MRRRKLVIAFAAAAVFGVLVVPASAELHRVSVTLVTGQTLTLTVDVPPGASVESIDIPGLPAPVQSISDLGPVATATPTPPATPTPAPTQTPRADNTPTPTPSPTEPPGDGNQSTPARGHQGGGNKGGGKQVPSQSDPSTLDPSTEALTGELDEPVKESEPEVDESNPTRNVDGSPTLDNPTVSLATPGPARIGVPNFFIEKFRIPPFLLPIYQAAGIEYGVRWEVLAAINEIETDYGRNLNVSSAGALGWMQFMPASWDAYGVDGNRDGVKDPYNPVDAIFAAARYLKAAGADTDLRGAIFAYNHADWYVDSVILRARYIGGLPADLVGSLSGLTQGRFPVQAKASYAKDVRRTEGEDGPSYVVESSSRRNGIKIFAKAGSPVVAVNDGRIVKTGHSRRLGNFVTLQDVYGNTYTYGHLKSVVKSYPTPKRKAIDDKQVRRELKLPPRDAAPDQPASATTKSEAAARRSAKQKAAKVPTKERRAANGTAAPSKERLFANPERPNSAAAGGDQQAYTLSEDFGSYLNRVFGLDRSEVDMKPLERGARITSGTVLGHIGRVSKRTAPHLMFEIRPAGRGAPRIDPKPILDGWKLLESTAIYRAANRNPFVGKDAQTPSIGQILLMSKEALSQRVLANPNVQIYGCGREDIRSGQIDRRVLATLEFLVSSGLKPTVTSLRCGHSFYTASGNVSEHTTGTAVDIAAINGIPMMGHQGAGSITELAIQRLLTLQGTMKPHQIISLMEFQGADNTLALSDHADHIHVGFRPLYGANAKTAKQVDAILKPEQWIKLIDRLDEIDNPEVSRKPSKYAVDADADRRASPAHKGE